MDLITNKSSHTTNYGSPLFTDHLFSSFFTFFLSNFFSIVIETPTNSDRTLRMIFLNYFSTNRDRIREEEYIYFWMIETSKDFLCELGTSTWSNLIYYHAKIFILPSIKLFIQNSSVECSIGHSTYILIR